MKRMPDHTLNRVQEARSAALPTPVTFVLPGRGHSGGVRVTVEMANGLLETGYRVRIACRNSPQGRLKRSLKRFREGLLRQQGDWIPSFRGRLETFRTSLSEIRFHSGEVVIAVGSHTVRYVDALDGDVVKVRYCHGFTGSEPELMTYAWGTPMVTVAVAPGLVPELQRLSGTDVAAVIPNGIHARDYFADGPFIRDGIGTVYYEHPNKSPEHTLRVLEMLRERRPDIPQYVFGADVRPTRIPRCDYHRLPSVRTVRELYNRSKVWFLTSKYEGFGLPMLEAMACGCSVVTTRHQGCEGLIENGKNGFIVPHGDLEQLVGRVEQLLDNHLLRRGFVTAGFDTVRAYSWANAIKAMDAFLRTLQEQGEAR